MSTINISIDIYTKVELVLQKKGISIELPDLNKAYCFSSLAECLESKEEHLSLVQAQLMFWKPKPSTCFKLIVQSESPIGAGLGASSSLCISLIKVFKELAKHNFCTQPLEDILEKNEGVLFKNQIVNLAANLEAKVLKMPTGTQDYFPALTEGLHIVDYGPKGFVDNLLTAPYLNSLAKHLVLVYTGQPHHSGISNWKIIRDYLDGSKSVSLALQGLAEVSQEMKKCFCQLEENFSKNEDFAKKWFSNIPKLFIKELGLRKQLNSGFVTKEIESLRSVALQWGGVEIKVCGAGAGGCVLVWVDAEKKISLQKKLKEHKYKVLDFNFVSKS
ncbi:MAG: hypothetical protein HAW63_05295 [Bdellovibrionaceae bacterium]|nr:hypothetical protein [Pseudobdellovibrionaceae bacterium]